MTESEKRIPPFGLRMPPDLKERISTEARKNNRSMNAEIVDRLERSFEFDRALPIEDREWLVSLIMTAIDNAVEGLNKP